MSSNLNLKEIEKRAFRSTYQDGLWDIYYGLIVMAMALFIYHPEKGYGWWNIVLMSVCFLVFYFLFFLGKKYITVPRLGRVAFGEIRRKRNRTMGVVLVVFIGLQVLLVITTATGWLSREFGSWVANHFPGSNDLMLVSTIGSLMVCIGMAIIAHFTDFIRGYYIAILMALAVFIMIFLNQPLIPVILGSLIIIPGLVLLMRFLKKYPLPKNEVEHD
jgi:hypothetical protein